MVEKTIIALPFPFVGDWLEDGYMTKPKGLEDSTRRVLGKVFLTNIERHMGGSVLFFSKTLCLFVMPGIAVSNVVTMKRHIQGPTP